MDALPKVDTRMRTYRYRGFSLIELMITMAILAIVAALAVSSYRRYAIRANRTEAKTTLLSIQVAQEKWFLQNNAYAQDVATLRAAPPGGLGIPISAAGVTPNGYYTISVAAATPNTYTIQADANGTQTNDVPACLTYTINETGVRTPAESTGCWK
jgi:type IV pilus assembly protein PilE